MRLSQLFYTSRVLGLLILEAARKAEALPFGIFDRKLAMLEGHQRP